MCYYVLAMDLKGYNRIKNTLQDLPYGGKGDIFPTIKEGQEARFITIQAQDQYPPSFILNTLGKAGLMKIEGPKNLGFREGPELVAISAVNGCVTLEDKNFPVNFNSEII